MTFPLRSGSHWELPPEKLQEWQETYWPELVDRELPKALQWLRDNPVRRKTARGMTRFLGQWLSRASSNVYTTRDKANWFERMIGERHGRSEMADGV